MMPEPPGFMVNYGLPVPAGPALRAQAHGLQKPGEFRAGRRPASDGEQECQWQ
jgi:hypothetical protein